MSFQRDLAWQNIELKYQSSIAHQFARYALGLNYDLLPMEVVHQAKRCLLDTLGCAIGAYDAPGRPICEDVVGELGGREESTVFGSGLRTTAPNATLVNSFLVRFLDFNDQGPGGHNSDSIPGILAVAEREKSGGKDFLTSLVIAYELCARVALSMTNFFHPHYWTDVRAGLGMPPALGKLMKLNEEQIANATGACACHCLPLGILDANSEEYVMSKNLRFGWVSYNAIMCCMLAKKGFTGPRRIVEGELGFREVVLRNDMDLEHLVDFGGWKIMGTQFKTLCLNTGTQGPVLATIAIVEENDLKPEDIAKVRVKTSIDEWRHCTTPAKKYPRNPESADHSEYYAHAIAIKERHVGPEAFEPEKFTDPVVLDLIEKITVEGDANVRGGISVITTRDGRRFEKRIDTARGYGENVLSDEELEEKFRGMASKYMPEKQIKSLFDNVWNVEKLDDMTALAKLMAVS